MYMCICLYYITVNYIGSSLMLRYTEGATWTAIVAALVTPLGGIYWFFFQIPDGGDLETYWNWDNSDIFIIVGLFFMAPFIFLYDRETQKQEKLKKEQMEYMNQGYKGYRDLEGTGSSPPRKVVL